MLFVQCFIGSFSLGAYPLASCLNLTMRSCMRSSLSLACTRNVVGVVSNTE